MHVTCILKVIKTSIQGSWTMPQPGIYIPFWMQISDENTSQDINPCLTEPGFVLPGKQYRSWRRHNVMKKFNIFPACWGMLFLIVFLVVYVQWFCKILQLQIGPWKQKFEGSIFCKENHVENSLDSSARLGFNWPTHVLHGLNLV